MPKTLTDEWKKELGQDYENVHILYLNIIGNLTLTGYNSKLSNKSFKEKKEMYINSNLSLNRYFKDIETWNSDTIQKRSEELANMALKIWPFFGEISQPYQNVTGTKPNSLYVFGKEIKVESWREVLIETMNAIIERVPDKFNLLAEQFPKYINKNREELREVRELPNGYYIEVNLSAEMIKRLCIQFIEALDFSSEDWRVGF